MSTLPEVMLKSDFRLLSKLTIFTRSQTDAMLESCASIPINLPSSRIQFPEYLGKDLVMTWTDDAEFGENIIFAANPRLFSRFHDETENSFLMLGMNVMQTNGCMNRSQRLINTIAIFAIIKS